jgi:hypothetical protein
MPATLNRTFRDARRGSLDRPSRLAFQLTRTTGHGRRAAAGAVSRLPSGVEVPSELAPERDLKPQLGANRDCAIQWVCMAARRLLWMLCLFALTGLLRAAGAAGAARVLHTGSTRYVRIVRLGDGQLSVALTAQGRKRFAQLMRGGYALDAICTRLGKSVQGFSQHSSSAADEESGGPNGRFTYHPLLDRHADFCDIGRVHLTIKRRSISSTQVPGPRLDAIALTQKGAAFLDEDRLTSTIFGALEVAIGYAQHRADGHFPPSGQFAAGFPLSRPRMVALVSPDASPPPGAIGFYSDGANHAEVVGISTLGRRLFIDSNAGVLSTNAAEHLVRATSAFS